jgi:hypothetical protein
VHLSWPMNESNISKNEHKKMVQKGASSLRERSESSAKIDWIQNQCSLYEN